MSDSQTEKVSEKNSSSAANNAMESFVQNELLHNTGSSGSFLPNSAAAESLPALEVENGSTPQKAAESLSKNQIQLAVTCRWIDDQGNTGLGDCDFESGTIRKYT